VDLETLEGLHNCGVLLPHCRPCYEHKDRSKIGQMEVLSRNDYIVRLLATKV
jgi:hypothetical protein